MADTGFPTISGIDLAFSGIASDPYDGGTDFPIWVVNAYTAIYATSSSIAGTANFTYLRWAGTAQPVDADYGVHLRARTQAAPTNSIGMYVRAVAGEDTGYRAAIAPSGNWSINKINAGSATLLASGNMGTLAASTFHSLEFYASGSSTTTLKLYVNGVLISNPTDSSSPITSQGYGVARIPVSSHWYLYGYQMRTETAGAFTVNSIPSAEEITNGDGSTLDLSGYVSGGTTPYSYAVNSGTLPSGLTLNATTGAVEGTTDTDEEQTVSFIITDSDVGSEVTNSIAFTVSSVVNDAPVWQGLDIDDMIATEGIVRAGFDISSYWADPGDTFTIQASTGGSSWPTGVTIVSGVITFDESTIVAGTYTGLIAEADDGVNIPTQSNTFQITVNAASTATRQVTTPALHNGGGSILASTAVNWIWFPTDLDTSLSAGDWVSGSGTTSALGVLVTSATLQAGAGHLVVYTASYAKVYYGKLTAA